MMPNNLHDTLIDRRQTFITIGDGTFGLALGDPIGRRWWIALGVAMAFKEMLVYVLNGGMRVQRNNNLDVWALHIVSCVWWIGIANGGLLLSALLILLGTEYRRPLNRIAETMALIAAVAAGLYPVVHLGRPWFL